MLHFGYSSFTGYRSRHGCNFPNEGLRSNSIRRGVDRGGTIAAATGRDERARKAVVEWADSQSLTRHRRFDLPAVDSFQKPNESWCKIYLQNILLVLVILATAISELVASSFLLLLDPSSARFRRRFVVVATIRPMADALREPSRPNSPASIIVLVFFIGYTSIL